MSRNVKSNLILTERARSNCKYEFNSSFICDKSAMSLQKLAEQYFSKLNPTAKRLYADINDTKAAYDTLWTTLSQEEKDQILNDSIIKPEVTLQYASVNCDIQNSNGYGLKIVLDDNYSYRDEHSAPFSFRTASQRDLRIFCNYEVASKTVEEFQALEYEESPESCDSNELSPDTNTTSSSTMIPKTGLDLLDNW